MIPTNKSLYVETFDTPYGQDAQCSGCGGDIEWEDCWQCSGEGGYDEAESDPINYAEGECWNRCEECKGRGGWNWCASCKQILLADKPFEAAKH